MVWVRTARQSRPLEFSTINYEIGALPSKRMILKVKMAPSTRVLVAAMIGIAAGFVLTAILMLVRI